jgi:hypothetical protein
MLASRARLSAYLKQRQRLLDGLTLGPWYVSKAFAAEEFSDRFLPEDAIDLEALDASAHPLWQKRPDYEDGRVHALPRVEPPSVAYVFRTVTSQTTAGLTAGLGSNDGLEVWLNGRKVLSNNIGRTAAPNQDLVDLDLAAGDNELLLKVFNRGGGTGFYFSLQIDPMHLLWRKLSRDFPVMTEAIKTDLEGQEYVHWFERPDFAQLEQKMIASALSRLDRPAPQLRSEFEKLSRRRHAADSRRRLDLYVKVVEAGRKIALALLDAPMLFVKRHPYMAGHIYDDYLTYNPGGGIYIIENPSEPLEKQRIRAVIDPDTPETLGVGVYRDPDISWDGKRVLFAFKGRPDGDSSIYEIGVDGRGLRRLTNPSLDTCTHLSCISSNRRSAQSAVPEAKTFSCNHHSCPKKFPHGAIGTGRHDITPAYLPDGRIVFTSTRPANRVPCFNSLVDVLHVMDADGSNIRCISVNNVNEFDPAVLPDGRIVFGRWEYVDKTALYMQSLWTIFPDGTNETALFANNLAKPTAILDARPIPGTHLIAAALTPHNGQSVGAIAVIDPHRGKNDLAAITNFTPKYPTEMDQGLKKGPCDPWPLSKDVMLIANNAEERGPHGVIEMIDRFGRRQLVHAEPDISCYSPMLVKPRPTPKTTAQIAKRRATRESTAGADPSGRFFVQDVHQGLGGVKPGEVKWLRVVEETARVSGIPKGGRWWNQAFLISWQGGYTVKNILGVVPVHEDGSAYFEAPSGRALYFELLDEQGCEIQRMRTFVQAAPGVTRSCIGCHESKMTAPISSRRGIAQQYPPAKPKPESWGSGFVDYPTMVQPILDKHCVNCHGGQQGIAAGIDLSGGWTWAFNISYETLIKNTLVGFLNCHNSSVDTARILPARTYGSGAAPLSDLLVTGHKGRIKKLSRKERDLIMAWMDTNCNYYGTWNWTEHATCNQIFDTGKELTEVMKQAGCTQCHSGHIGNDWINLRNPQHSRILRAPLAKGDGGLGLAWCRDRKAPEDITLVNQSHQPPDIFSPSRTPPPDLSGEPVVSFASTSDEHYRTILDIIHRGRGLALAKPRVDMPGATINPGICRQLAPLSVPEKLPQLNADLTGQGTVTLSWQRSAEMIGLMFELHRSYEPGFAPRKETLAGATTLFQFEDKHPPRGRLYYALLATADGKQSNAIYTYINVPSPSVSAATGSK